MMHRVEIDPRDKLFFRDARPIGGSSVGEGVQWPLPSVFHSAMLSALLSKWETHQQWEHKHNLNEKDKNLRSSFRFGGLKTFGPFPSLNGELHFPIPADIEPGGALMKLGKISGSSNLPKPLTCHVFNASKPSKEAVGHWISESNLMKYLKEENFNTVLNSEIFYSETAPGIEIDPNTGTTVDKKFYQAEYLRLQQGVSMSAFASCEVKDSIKSLTDAIKEFFGGSSQMPVIMGGQRGIVNLYRKDASEQFIPSLKQVSGKYLKWIILSPALFNGGWLPDWIDRETGDVKLKLDKKIDISAKLIAARVPKPVAYSGWKLDSDKDCAGGGPKATRLLVPAGSVYYFECASENDAKNLFASLNGRVKSNLLGEQGFGLGICSQFKI